MTAGHLVHSLGLLVLPTYVLVTLAIGWLARRHEHDANSYLNASRSLPLWIVTAAYLAANCGALEIIGLSAMAAEYGVAAFDFYWIGAIPAMVFLAIWMMPVYRRTRIRTVPEYLEVRYGPRLRLLNACVVAIVMLLLAGISLYAVAQVLQAIVGVGFQTSIVVTSAVVLVYVLVGGLRATIYNEVFQLAVMLAGLLPLAIATYRHSTPHSVFAAREHLWLRMPLSSQAAPLDIVGVALGLGFVLSFGYWCTDFIMMQRAFASRTDSAARQVPIWAGFGKLVFSFIVVIPGLAAFNLLPQLGRSLRYDQALPSLMTVFYSPVMLNVGLTALLASLMSSLAANISGFAAVWTHDIYRRCIVTHKPDHHYVLVGRIAMIVAISVSLAESFIDFLFGNLMEHIQLVFSIFGAPFWAIFLLGVCSRRVTERAAIAGFSTGSATALLHLLCVSSGRLRYGSVMNANFHVAVYSFSAAVLVAVSVTAIQSRATAQHTVAPAGSSLAAGFKTNGSAGLYFISALLLALCAYLNYLWR